MWNRLKRMQWMNKNLLNFLIFMSFLSLIFVHTTYLFRNSTHDRERVNGIKSEKNIDIVCIGGSSTFVYWEPYLAWKEYGMTSYNLATNSIRPPLIKGYVKYALNTQNPKLLVIDVRSFTGEKGSIDDNEGGIRNVTDSMNLSGNRFQTITETLKYFNAFDDKDVDVASYYFDISKYHGDYNRLGNEINWKYINNECVSKYKGFEFIEDPCHSIIQEPIDYQTEDMKKLEPEKEYCLKNLLEYLNKSNITALFIAGPIPISKEEQMQYNTIDNIVTSYGYNFLNTNNYYQEMDIDFSKDFYNIYHVNVYGAEKYTRFLADYIKKNYYVTDWRKNEIYKEWDDDYSLAKVREKEVKELIDKQIIDKKKAYEKGLNLKKIDNNFDEWCNIVLDENYIVLALSKGDVPNISLPWNISSKNHDIIRVYSGDTRIFESDKMLDRTHEGTIGTDGKKYGINSGEKSELFIDDKQYNTDEEGLYLLVYDKNYNQVLDAVSVSIDINGECIMRHIE